MARITPNAIRQNQIQQQEKNKGGEKAVQSPKAVSAAHLGQRMAAPALGLSGAWTLATSASAAQPLAGMTDTSPTGNPFVGLPQLATADTAGQLPMLARSLNLDADLAPDPRLAKVINELEMAGAKMGEGKGKDQLSTALAKLRQGAMLNTSDAKDTHLRKSPAAKDAVYKLASEVAKMDVAQGEQLLAKKMAGLKLVTQRQGGGFPMNMDVNAFVQAVLRESYLLQNDILKDRADKAKFYNEQKKKVLQKQAALRELQAKAEDGDLLSEFLEKPEEWWQSLGSKELFDYQNPSVEEGGDETGGRNGAGNANAKAKDKKEELKSEAVPLSTDLNGQFAVLSETPKEALPDWVKQLLAEFVGVETVAEQKVIWERYRAGRKENDDGTETATPSKLPELAAVIGLLDNPAEVPFGYLMMLNLTASPVSDEDLVLAKSFVESLSPAEASAFYVNYKDSTSNGGTRNVWLAMDLQVPELRAKAIAFDDAAELFGDLAGTLGMEELVALAANIVALPGDPETLLQLKVALGKATPTQARALLAGLLQADPETARAVGSELFFSLGPDALKNAAPADWQFLADFGGAARRFHAKWAGIENTPLMISAKPGGDFGPHKMKRVEKPELGYPHYTELWLEMARKLQSGSWQNNAGELKNFLEGKGAHNVLKAMVRFADADSISDIGYWLIFGAGSGSGKYKIRGGDELARQFIDRMSPAQAAAFLPTARGLADKRPDLVKRVEDRANAHKRALENLGEWRNKPEFKAIAGHIAGLDPNDIDANTEQELYAEMWKLDGAQLKTLFAGLKDDNTGLLEKIGGKLLNASNPVALRSMSPEDFSFLDGVPGSSKQFLDAWRAIVAGEEARSRANAAAADATADGEEQVASGHEDPGAAPRVDPVLDPNLDPPSDAATSKPLRYSDEEAERYKNFLDGRLKDIGGDAQLANMDLQDTLQKQQQLMQMMSNISKMLHDTAMSIIRKMGG